jgi:hypothetical protein
MVLTLTDTKAAVSSRRGIVMVFRGETRDFAITSSQWTSSCTLTKRMYEHCPYPDALASEKWWSSVDFTGPKPFGLKHLRTLKSLSKQSSFLHFSHLILIWSGTGSSQSVPSRHSSWSSCLPTNRTGATNPRGSYIELIVDRIPLQVRGVSWRVIHIWKVSDSTHQ